MIAIRADNEILDLFPVTKILVTKQQRNLRNWANRSSDFTRSIDVPRTPRNNLTLLPFVQNGVQDIPGNIEISGVSLGFDLKFSVNEFSDRFTLQIIFDNQLIFDSIQGNIKDLNFDDLAFDWTQAGVNGIKATTDIVYAYAHWFDLKSYHEIVNTLSTVWLTDQEIRAGGFFIYTKELFDRIITDADFTLDISNITGNDLYNNTALPCVVDKFIEPDLTTTQEEEIKTGSQVDYITSEDRIIFDTVVTAGASYWDNVTDTEFDFTLDTNMDLNAFIDGFTLDTKENPASGLIVPPVLRLRRNEITIHEWDIIENFPLSISEHIFAENGDEVYFDIFWGAGGNNGVTILADSWLKISSFNQDTSIDVANYVPDISQAELIKGIINHTNLILSSQQNTIVLYDFSKIFEGYHEVELLDDREQIETFSFPNLFKTSIIKYQDPPEPLLRTDTSFQFRVNDESLSDKGVILNLPFEASDIIATSYNGNTLVPLLDAYEIEIFDGIGLTETAAQSTFTISTGNDFKAFDWIIVPTNGQIRRILSKDTGTTGTIVGTWANSVANAAFKIVSIKKKRRPLQLVYLESANDFDVFDETNASPTTISSGIKASFGENMLMGNIAGDRYLSLIESMKFPKMVQVWVKIDAGEMLITGEESILYKAFYINKLNERFWVNRLDQWDPETGICRAELIRLR